MLLMIYEASSKVKSVALRASGGGGGQAPLLIRYTCYFSGITVGKIAPFRTAITVPRGTTSGVTIHPD